MILFSATQRRATAAGMVVKCVIVDGTPGFKDLILLRDVRAGKDGDRPSLPFNLHSPQVTNRSIQVVLSRAGWFFESSIFPGGWIDKQIEPLL